MFDKFVRDKLRDHQSPVPQGLWEKIERKKDKRPKAGYWRRPAAWAGLFLAGSLGVAYLLMQGPVKQDVDQADPTAMVNNGSGSGSAADNTAPAANNKTTTTLSSTNDLNNQGQGITANQPGAENSIGGEQHMAGLQANPGLQSSTGLNNGSQGNTPGRTSAITASRFPVKSVFNNSTQPAGLPGNTSQGVNRPSLLPATTPEEQQVEKYRFSKGNTYGYSPLLGLKTNDQLSLASFRIVGIDCPPNGREGRNDWYLEIYGSPDLPMKSVDGSGNAGYLAMKDSTESSLLSYTAGFRISKSIGRNLLIKSGLQYSQINERFSLRTENERRIITVVTIRNVMTPSGGDSTVSDTSTLMQIGYRVQKSFNKYRSLDIPLLLSYEFGNDNLQFAVNAGAIFNLYSWYSGNTLNDSLTVVPIGSKSTGIYKQNIGVGVYAGFSIIKPVSGKLDVFAEPYFRYNLSNMTRNSVYTQRFNAVGLSLGLRYKLNGQRPGPK